MLEFELNLILDASLNIAMKNNDIITILNNNRNILDHHNHTTSGMPLSIQALSNLSISNSLYISFKGASPVSFRRQVTLLVGADESYSKCIALW